jgi:hypothetical protein
VIESNQYQTGENFGNWMNQRCGKLTASRMAAAMTFLKQTKAEIEKKEPPKESAARRDLKVEILAERMTGDMVSKYVSREMQWGIDQEPYAKAAFEAKTGLIITDCGFIDHPRIDLCGASPDGFVSDGLLIEIKCPSTSTMINYILDGVVPEQYIPQMTLQSSVTGKDVWFCAYDPRIKHESKQLFIRKFSPTPEQIQKVETEAVKFLAEVDQMFDLITQES